MEIVDAHHHLWDVETNIYPWLSGPMHDRGWGDWSSLRRSYLIEDFLNDARHQNLVKSLHIQANFDPLNPVGETEWLDSVASQPHARGFPHGIVAFADLSAPDAEACLAAHAKSPRLRGIRQVLNRHPDPAHNRAPHDYLAIDSWQRNFGLLRRHGLSFDAQVYPHQMTALADVARKHAETPIIIDHCGMPIDRTEDGMEVWRSGLRLLSRCRNVSFKLSGFGMLDRNWSVESVQPIFSAALSAFGAERCMFASNFPVDKLMRDYDGVWAAYRTLAASLSLDEQRALFASTAMRVYRLET